MNNRVGVIGTGAFGIALSKLAYSNNHDVMAWTKFEAEKKLIDETGMNSQVLPNVLIPKEIKITTDLSEIVDFCEVIILAIPVSFLENTLIELGRYELSNKYFCIASKGIEEKNNLLLHELFNKYINSNNLALISGPSFAIDIIEGNTVGLSIASYNDLTYEKICSCLVNKHFILNRCDDMFGLELCGTIKNVIAIASGILGGLEVSDSTKAFFLTKALYEMEEILALLVGKRTTPYTLGGMGDLILTCGSIKSRNYQFGYLLAQDSDEAKEFLSNNTVEGMHALKSLIALIDKIGEQNKLITLIKKIIIDKKDPKLILDYLVQN